MHADVHEFSIAGADFNEIIRAGDNLRSVAHWVESFEDSVPPRSLRCNLRLLPHARTNFLNFSVSFLGVACAPNSGHCFRQALSRLLRVSHSSRPRREGFWLFPKGWGSNDFNLRFQLEFSY